jgi:hydrogenase/urease accessory protein HupE
MNNIAIASSRLFDASTVNGGAIEGLFFILVNLELLLALIAIGLLCSRMSSTWAFRSLGAFAVAWVVGSVLGWRGIDLPFSIRANLVSLTAIALGFITIKRIPIFVLLIAITIFGLTYANSAFVLLPSKVMKYMAAFAMASSAVSIGTTWTSLALGYVALSKRNLPNIARIFGVFAAIACAALILTQALRG